MVDELVPELETVPVDELPVDELPEVDVVAFSTFLGERFVVAAFSVFADAGSDSTNLLVSDEVLLLYALESARSCISLVSVFELLLHATKKITNEKAVGINFILNNCFMFLEFV